MRAFLIIYLFHLLIKEGAVTRSSLLFLSGPSIDMLSQIRNLFPLQRLQFTCRLVREARVEVSDQVLR